MSGLPEVGEEFLVVGGDPSLSFTPSGVAVTNFRVKAAKRKLVDEQSNKWEDDKVFWARVTCWRDIAEHVAESVANGDLVMVIGEVYVESFKDNQGIDRQAMCIDAKHVGPSLKFRTMPHGQGGQNQQAPPQNNQQNRQQAQPQGNQQSRPQNNQQTPAQGDPWATQEPDYGDNQPPF